jgi:predicted nucleotidyltransferase
MKMINDVLKEQILQIVFQYVNPDETAVFLFGSCARTEARRSSDIDLGILSSQNIPLEQLAGLRDALNEDAATLRRVDVVDFNRVADRIFLKNALKEMQIWYQGKDCKTTLPDLKKRILN